MFPSLDSLRAKFSFWILLPTKRTSTLQNKATHSAHIESIPHQNDAGTATLALTNQRKKTKAAAWRRRFSALENHQKKWSDDKPVQSRGFANEATRLFFADREGHIEETTFQINETQAENDTFDDVSTAVEDWFLAATSASADDEEPLFHQQSYDEDMQSDDEFYESFDALDKTFMDDDGSSFSTSTPVETLWNTGLSGRNKKPLVTLEKSSVENPSTFSDCQGNHHCKHILEEEHKLKDTRIEKLADETIDLQEKLDQKDAQVSELRQMLAHEKIIVVQKEKELVATKNALENSAQQRNDLQIKVNYLQSNALEDSIQQCDDLKVQVKELKAETKALYEMAEKWKNKEDFYKQDIERLNREQEPMMILRKQKNHYRAEAQILKEDLEKAQRELQKIKDKKLAHYSRMTIAEGDVQLLREQLQEARDYIDKIKAQSSEPKEILAQNPGLEFQIAKLEAARATLIAEHNREDFDHSIRLLEAQSERDNYKCQERLNKLKDDITILHLKRRIHGLEKEVWYAKTGGRADDISIPILHKAVESTPMRKEFDAQNAIRESVDVQGKIRTWDVRKMAVTKGEDEDCSIWDQVVREKFSRWRVEQGLNSAICADTLRIVREYTRAVVAGKQNETESTKHGLTVTEDMVIKVGEDGYLVALKDFEMIEPALSSLPSLLGELPAADMIVRYVLVYDRRGE